MFSDAWHDLKFFVMLRDPVKRCFSHYQMVTSEDGTEEQKINQGPDWQNKTFEEVINEDFSFNASNCDSSFSRGC